MWGVPCWVLLGFIMFTKAVTYEKWMFRKTRKENFYLCLKGLLTNVLETLETKFLYKDHKTFLLPLISCHCWWSNTSGKCYLYSGEMWKALNTNTPKLEVDIFFCEGWVTYNNSLGNKRICFCTVQFLENLRNF